jgi:DNA gyrase subunit A
VHATTREPLTLALYEGGAIKATTPDQFGGKGKPHKSNEGLIGLCSVAPDAFVLAATNKGRVFSFPVEKLTVTTRAGKSESIARHLKLETGERVISLLDVPGAAFGDNTAPLYLLEFSTLGKVKKSLVSDYKSASTVGLGSLKLAEGDEVITALLSNGQGEYLVTTNDGQTLRFSDEKLTAQGRVGQGQIAISLDLGARVVSASFWSGGNEAGAHLLVLTQKGLIKKTALVEYPTKGRATAGVQTTTLIPDDNVAAAWLGRDTTLLLVTQAGSTTVDTRSLPVAPRARKGLPLPWTGGGGSPRITPLGV